MLHPLRQPDGASLIAQIVENVGKTVDMKDIGRGMRIFKYKDAPRIKGADRCARGLILDADDRPVNLPLAKFDQAAPFCESMEEYHDALLSKIGAEPVAVQPKHDGTSIVAVCREGALIVSTFLSIDNAQAVKARGLLEGVTWEDGLTLQMELIWEKDPKLQSRRVADGLYLFYGCRDDGREMSREELATVSNDIQAITLVKEQRMSPSKVLTLVRRLDDITTRAELQEGVVVSVAGVRLKLKSWQYLNACGKPLITEEWLDKQVKAAKSLDQLHEICEGVTGVLDDALLARRLHARRLTAVREWMDDLINHPRGSVEEIKAAPKWWQPVLFQLSKQPNFFEDDIGTLAVIKGFRR